MKRGVVILFFWFLSLGVSGQERELIWEDNFNSGMLNTDFWTVETGTGVNGDFGTGQVDRATSREENISFADSVPGAEDGCLVLTTRKEYYIDRNYTSARIKTAEKKAWGPGHRIEARIFPRDVKYMGQGFAFWLMPDELPAGSDYLMWPQGGEVDIMEYVGSIPFHNLGSVHYAWAWNDNQWADWNHGHKGAYYSFETGEVPNPAEPGYGNFPPDPNNLHAGSAGFHTYGINWYSDRMEFFVDDQVYHIHYLNDGGAYSKDGEDQFSIQRLDGRRVGVSEYSNHFTEWHPFEHNMFVLLTAGVTGRDYSYGGQVSDEAVFPCSVFIDWVRVYKLDTQVGISEHRQNLEFSIQPNPAQDKLVLRFDELRFGPKTITITDLQGIIRKEIQEDTEKSITIDLGNLAAGIYVLSVKSRDGINSKRFVVTSAK